MKYVVFRFSTNVVELEHELYNKNYRKRGACNVTVIQHIKWQNPLWLFPFIHNKPHLLAIL